MKRFALAIPVLVIGFFFCACDDPTAPGISAQADMSPEFILVHGSDFQCTAATPASGEHDSIVVPPGEMCFVINANVRGNIKALQDSRLLVSHTHVHGGIYGEKADFVNVGHSTVQGNIELADGGPVSPSLVEVVFCDVDMPNGSVKIVRMIGEFVLGEAAIKCLPNRVRKGSIIIEDNIMPPGGNGLVMQDNTIDQGSVLVNRNVINTAPNKGLEIRGHTIGENLQVYRNTGSGSKIVENNIVSQLIECFDNQPVFIGGPNTGRKKEAPGQQCT